MGWKEEWTVEKRENLESFGSRAQDMLHCRGTHLKFDDAQAGDIGTRHESTWCVALSAAGQHSATCTYSLCTLAAVLRACLRSTC
jgi:hypothetical protein